MGARGRKVLDSAGPADHRALQVEAACPTDWTVPDHSTMYVQASIVEQLPDPLSPLFADMIDGAVTRSLQTLFGEILGENVIRDDDVGLPTVNGYAYYQYTPFRDGAADVEDAEGLWEHCSVGERWPVGGGGVTTLIRAIAGSSATGLHATSES